MENIIYQQSLDEFSSLNTPKESYSGTDLMQTFNNLGINIGSASQLTIDALFDTDCKATKAILEWLCKYPSTDNILSVQEIDEYKELQDNDEVLLDRQYDTELAKTLQDYPGILDYDNNSFEVTCMEDDLEILVSEKEQLEQVMLLNNDIKHKLSLKLGQLEEQEIMANSRKMNAYEDCLELSENLDQTRERLQSQIMRYSSQLNDYEYSDRTFISNTPTVKYNQQYEAVTSSLQLLLKQESLVQEHFNHEVNFDSLEFMRKRIANGFQNSVILQCEEERLNAELEFLKNVNLDEISTSQNFNDSSHMSTKLSLYNQKEMQDNLLVKLKTIAQKTADAIIDKPEMDMLKELMKAKSNKLNALSNKYSQIKSILSNHMLLYLLFKKEQNDIQATDNFFCDVHKYIIDNVYNSQLRTELMTDIINKYQLYKKLPMERKLPLIKIVKDLLLDPTNESNSIIDIKSFNNDCQQLEQQLFVHDFVNHRKFCRKLEKEIEGTIRFLTTGPTSQIVVIPNYLSDAFGEINQMIATQQSALKKSVQIINHSAKSLSEKKWFKIRRQLWMYFLIEPKRVIEIIKQIKAYLNQVRNQA